MVFGVIKLHLDAPTSIPGRHQFLTLETSGHRLCLAQQRAKHTVPLNDLATGPEVQPKIESESNITDVSGQENVILDPKMSMMWIKRAKQRWAILRIPLLNFLFGPRLTSDIADISCRLHEEG